MAGHGKRPARRPNGAGLPAAPVLPNDGKHRLASWGGNGAAKLTRECLALHGDVCWICGMPGATTADHIIRRVDGGPDELWNLLPAHGSCNSRRGLAMQRADRLAIAPQPVRNSRQW